MKYIIGKRIYGDSVLMSNTGEIIAHLPKSQRQPNRNKRTIMYNCSLYPVFWIDPKMKIYDNVGETLDRYTIVMGDLDMYGCAENPQTFAQYCGNAADNYWYHAWGANWRKYNSVRKCVNYVCRMGFSHLGTEVDFFALNEDVKNYILSLFVK